MRNPFTTQSRPTTGSRRISYAAIAAALAVQKPNDADLDAVSPTGQWYRIALNLADVLGAGNPKFNRKRFLLAAGAL